MAFQGNYKVFYSWLVTTIMCSVIVLSNHVIEPYFHTFGIHDWSCLFIERLN